MTILILAVTILNLVVNVMGFTGIIVRLNRMLKVVV